MTGSRYNKTPTSLQARFGVSLGINELRQQLPGVNLPWAKVNNHKLTLSLRGETLTEHTMLESLIPDGIIDSSQLYNSHRCGSNS